MAKITVKDGKSLPVGPTHYVRCMSDHTIMIHGRTGDSYVREDGEPWTEDGFVTQGDGFRVGAAWAH